MNYIKKKIKGSKKDEANILDDFDPKSVNPKSNKKLPEKESSSTASVTVPQEQANTESEEWKAFQQLTQRVQDTVEKSQTSLTKLKESTVSTDVSRRADYDYVSSDEENTEQLKAPAESLRSWIDFNDSTDSRTLDELTSPESVVSAKPERPPPPAAKTKRRAPARPPPPGSGPNRPSDVTSPELEVATKQTNGELPYPEVCVDPLNVASSWDSSPGIAADDSRSTENSRQESSIDASQLDFSYLERSAESRESYDLSYLQRSGGESATNICETIDCSLNFDFGVFDKQTPEKQQSLELTLDYDFGFNKNPSPSIVINPCEALLLEDDGKPVDDPFDTSHVDIINRATAVTPVNGEGPDPFDTSFADNLE